MCPLGVRLSVCQFVCLHTRSPVRRARNQVPLLCDKVWEGMQEREEVQVRGSLTELPKCVRAWVSGEKERVEKASVECEESNRGVRNERGANNKNGATAKSIFFSLPPLLVWLDLGLWTHMYILHMGIIIANQRQKATVAHSLHASLWLCFCRTKHSSITPRNRV